MLQALAAIPATLRVKVLLPFFNGTEVVPEGAEIEVSRAFAHELIGANKAKLIAPDKAARPDPLAEKAAQADPAAHANVSGSTAAEQAPAAAKAAK